MLRQPINWSKHTTHGRANEITEISTILKQIDQGAPSRVVAITGPSGVGKSVLVTEGVFADNQGGYTASGKFDQFLPQTPYAAVLRCLRVLFHAFFYNPATPPNLRTAHAQSLIDLVGPNKEILCAAIPELAPLLAKGSSASTSPPPSSPSSSPPTMHPAIQVSSLSDTRNRFHSLFLGILAMITAERMVTLFIDDVQWADTASIDLIAALVEGQRRRLLFIVASREPSLPPALSALPLTVTFPINPFVPHQVLEYVRAVLQLPLASALALANAIHSRSAGNPFFFSQLLRQAVTEGIVSYDPRSDEWTVDNARIPHMAIASSDVVEFLLAKFTRLPPEVSETLRVAACLGSAFSLDTLEAVLARLQADSNGLYLAEAEGFVVREPITATRSSMVFHFSHDRVMQAAHAKNTEEQIQQIHLAAGEVLSEQTGDLYEIADHFAKAIALVSSDRFMDLCSLFLRVARNAKLAAAFDSACRYAQLGLDILAKVHQEWDDSWRQHYDVTYNLSMIVMECAFTNGDHALSDARYEDVQQHATLESCMLAVSARMILLVNGARFAEAIDLGCAAFARMAIPNVTLPRHPSNEELGAVFAVIDGLLQNSTTDTILNLPAAHSLISIAVTVLMSTSTASYFSEGPSFAYSTSLMVQLTIQHGITPQATPGIALYGLLCSGVLGNCDRAYEIGEVAMRLSDKYGIPAYQCQVHLLFSSAINFYRNHVRDNVPLLRRGLILCTQVGNTLFAAFNVVHLPVTRLWKGDPLEDVATECLQTLDALGGQCRFADGMPMTSALLYCARALMGVAAQKDLDASRVIVSPFSTAWAATIRVKANSLLHKYEDVLDDVTTCCQNLFDDIKGQMHTCMFLFHYSITLATLYHRANSPGQITTESSHYVDKMNDNIVALRKWAKNSQINCEHRCVLIEAELAHIAHRDDDALRLYETALNLAEERDFHQHTPIILERMANFFARTGQMDRARDTISRSIDGYVRWGACAVVSLLIAEHSELLRATTLISLDPIPDNVPASANIDMQVVLQCSSVVCESSNLGKLLTNFLSHIATYFRVAHGCVILTNTDEKSFAHVLWGKQTTETPCATLLSPPVLIAETFMDLSSMVCCSRAVRCAMVMKRTVVVNDLPASGIYADPYFTIGTNGSARSLVCMPLLLHGSVRGFVYLEGSALQTFTVGNLQSLQLMCAQAAIAVENSRLVQNETAARAEAEAATVEKEVLLQEMVVSKQRYQMLAQSIPQLIWTSRADGYVEWANDQYSTYVGGEVHGDAWSQYLHPDDLVRIRAAWLGSTSNSPGGSPTFSEEMRLRAADGTYQWFLSRALPAHDSKGNVVRWFGTSTNIEEQKKTLDERARLLKVELSLKHYRTLAEALPQLVWTSLPDGRVNYYNAKWEEFSGVTLEEGVVMGWWPLVHPADLEACRKQFARAMQRLKGFEVECRLRRHDGVFRWYLVRAVRVKDTLEELSPSSRPTQNDELGEPSEQPTQEMGYYYFGTGTDIDDQKKAEVSLIDARKAAERMAELKSQWVANMSHELRTPSNGILGMLDLLMDTPLNAEQKDYVATMRRSTNVLLTVISDILDFRRNETRQVKLQVEPFSVHGVMEDVCEILFPLAAQKNIELVHVVAPDVPRMLAGDAARLRQVLVNLISNSIKFSNDSGGVVEVTCQLTTQEPDDGAPASGDQTGPSSSTLSSPVSSPESSPMVSPTQSPTLAQRYASLRLQGVDQVQVPQLSTAPRRRFSGASITPFLNIPPTTLSATVSSPSLSLKTSTPTSATPPAALLSVTPPPTTPPPIAPRPTTPPQLTPPHPTPPHPTPTTAASVRLKFTVSDSGVGIPKEQQAMLFEPFFQVDSSATRKYGGTGLGLAISRQIVAALGGRIWVQSEEGSGSTFSFTSQFFIPPPFSAQPVTPPPLRTSSENPSSPTMRSANLPSRFFSPPSHSPQPEPLNHSNFLPQQVVMYSDRKGAVMRVAQGYLAQLIPPATPSSPSRVIVVDTAYELPIRLSSILSNPSPLLPYIACVLEVSDVPSINAVLSSVSSFLSRRDCICRIVLITIPHLRSQITLPTTTQPFHHPAVVFLMKPLSESKLRNSLSLTPSTTNTPTPSALPPKVPQINPPKPANPLSLSGSLSSLESPLSPSLRASYPQFMPSSPGRPPITYLHFPRRKSLTPEGTNAPTPENHQSSAPVPHAPPLRLAAIPDEAQDNREQRVRRALCVEDNVVNQKVILWHLKKLGFTLIDIANDGSEAVERVNSHPLGYYEFILMDLQMPVMDGFVATRLIREREATQSSLSTPVSPIPIIAITANVMPGVQQRCSEAGMDGYVSKPVQAPQLLQVLKDLAIIM